LTVSRVSVPWISMGVKLPWKLHDEIKRYWPTRELFTGILDQNRLVASNVLWCQRIPHLGRLL
jgi:hypothetical protein